MPLAIEVEVQTALIAAGAALLGAVIGGLMAAGATWLFEIRKDGADRRQAVRLVAEEIRTIYFHYELLDQSGVAPQQAPSGSVFMPTTQWEKYGPTLARHLQDRDWDSVGPFMDAVPTMRTVMTRLSTGTQLSAEYREKVRDGMAFAERAYKTLSGREIME